MRLIHAARQYVKNKTINRKNKIILLKKSLIEKTHTSFDDLNEPNKKGNTIQIQAEKIVWSL